jgi:hypothetical protein
MRETRWPTGATQARAGIVIALGAKSRESSAIPGQLAAADPKRDVADWNLTLADWKRTLLDLLRTFFLRTRTFDDPNWTAADWIFASAD